MTTVGVLVHEGKTLGKGPDELRRRLADAGHADAHWATVSKSKKAPEKVRKLLDEGVERLLVWGGDGTVRRCIDTSSPRTPRSRWRSCPPARPITSPGPAGVPTDLEGAVDVAVNGIPWLIDVGIVNGQVFAVMAGTGFDALMIRDADDAAKARFGRLVVHLGRRPQPQATGVGIKVSVDGNCWFRGRASCVLVGNVGTDHRRYRRLPARPPRRRNARYRGRHRPTATRLGAGRASRRARSNRLVTVRADDRGDQRADQARPQDAVGARRRRPAPCSALRRRHAAGSHPDHGAGTVSTRRSPARRTRLPRRAGCARGRCAGRRSSCSASGRPDCSSSRPHWASCTCRVARRRAGRRCRSRRRRVVRRSAHPDMNSLTEIGSMVSDTLVKVILVAVVGGAWC